MWFRVEGWSEAGKRESDQRFRFGVLGYREPGKRELRIQGFGSFIFTAVQGLGSRVQGLGFTWSKSLLTGNSYLWTG